VDGWDVGLHTWVRSNFADLPNTQADAKLLTAANRDYSVPLRSPLADDIYDHVGNPALSSISVTPLRLHLCLGLLRDVENRPKMVHTAFSVCPGKV
jgi:hypothetical protein